MSSPEMHVHTSRTETGFDPDCVECQKIEGARRSALPAQATPDEVFDRAAQAARTVRNVRDGLAPSEALVPADSSPPSVLLFRSGSGTTEVSHRRGQDVKVHMRRGSDSWNAEDVDNLIGALARIQDAGQVDHGYVNWTVTDPYAGTDHHFEDARNALMYAVDTARPDRATVIRRPGGEQRFILIAEDAQVVVQAVRQLSGGMRDTPPPVERPGASVQELAGARLFYCLYHDKDLVLWAGDNARGGKAMGFNKAYVSAQNAFLPSRRRGDEPIRDGRKYRTDGDSVVTVAPSVDPVWAPPSPAVPDGRRDGTVQPAVAAMLMREGRREAADAVAALFAGRRAADYAEILDAINGPNPDLTIAFSTDLASLLVAQGRREAAEAIRSQARSFVGPDQATAAMELAARLAEGSTGVKDGGGS